MSVPLRPEHGSGPDQKEPGKHGDDDADQPGKNAQACDNGDRAHRQISGFSTISGVQVCRARGSARVDVGADRSWRQAISLILDIGRHVLQFGQVLAAVVCAEEQLTT